MANTATPLGLLGGFGGGPKFAPVRPYLIHYDTIDTDLTVRTPDAGQRVAVVGLVILNDADYVLSFKSASTIIETFKFSANSGLALPFTPGNPAILLSTEAGEALKLACNAALPPFLLYTLAF